GRIVTDVGDQEILRRIRCRVRAIEDAPVLLEVGRIELPNHLDVLGAADDRSRADAMPLARPLPGERRRAFEHDGHLVSERCGIGGPERAVARDARTIRPAPPKAGRQIAGRPARADDRDLTADLAAEPRLVPLEWDPSILWQILRASVHGVGSGGYRLRHRVHAHFSDLLVATGCSSADLVPFPT